MHATIVPIAAAARRRGVTFRCLVRVTRRSCSGRVASSLSGLGASATHVFSSGKATLYADSNYRNAFFIPFDVRSFSTRKLDDEIDHDEDIFVDDEDAANADPVRLLEKQRLNDAVIRAELEKKTGRGWTDELDTEQMMNSNETFADLPDWSPRFVSRISNDRIQLYPDKIPTLDALAILPLHPPPPPNPGLGKRRAYALYRKRALYQNILERVREMVQEDRLASIRALESWEDKQDAVDDLFDEITKTLQRQETILGKHPLFEEWVEKALEEHLQQIQSDKEGSAEPTAAQSPRVPIFMDCFGPEDSADSVVPKILSPLKVWERGNMCGRMVEEWQLSAHKVSKRIMLRHCTQIIASKVLPNAETGKQQARILVTGRQGVGKSAALAAIVASARTSGAIVLYLPDGNRLRQNGYYVEPSLKRKGVFDLPILTQQVCQQLLGSHKDELAQFSADKAHLARYLTSEQLKVVLRDSADSVSLADILQAGAIRTALSAPCYAAAVDVLMNQEKTSFFIVLDEFNCYFGRGHYFHADYDEDVKKPIPYDNISLFQPALDAMAINAVDIGEYGDLDAEEKMKPPVCMKRGAVIVAISESHGIPRKVTDTLILNAKQQRQQQQQQTDTATAPIYVVDVPFLSSLEIEHMLSHYEAIGVGNLRMDRGETVMNEQEVAYLSMVSGGVPQKLLDACIHL